MLWKGYGGVEVWWAVGFSGHGRSSQSGGVMGMSNSGRCGWGKWGRRARVGGGFIYVGLVSVFLIYR